jgi:hypothetical protein
VYNYGILKDIPGYEGLYAATEKGRIYSYRSKRCVRPYKLKSGYLHIPLTVNYIQKHFLVHRLVYAAYYGEIPEGVVIDHVNRKKTDNKLENLRAGNKSLNAFNATKRKGKYSSKYKGVTLVRNQGSTRWKASVGLRRIGIYATEIEAARAYNKAAKELAGEFACLNIFDYASS